jgi:NAD(P)H-nitrite reductase large subunit/rubredoxin
MICGEVFEGENPPVPCPVCGAGESAFEKISSSSVKRWKCEVCGEVFEGENPPVPCPVCGAGKSAFSESLAPVSEFKREEALSYVVIGGGAAASECVFRLREINRLAKITLICGEGVYPYNRPALSDVIADNMSLEAITLYDPEKYGEAEINVMLGRVRSIDRYSRMVMMENGSFVSYDRLAICTGGNAFCPVQGDVITIRSYDDARKVADLAKPGKKAVVVGGGILGIEAATALADNGVEVCVTELLGHIVSAQCDAEYSKVFEKHLEKNGIKVYTAVSVEKVCDGKVVLSDGRELEADFVIVSAGVRPETSLAAKAGLEINKGIVTDKFMRTSDSLIFAAGDCTECEGQLSGLWQNALMQGSVAASSMCGGDDAYMPPVPATAFSWRGFSIFSAGDFRTKPDAKIVFESADGKSRKKLLFSGGKLIAGVIIGDGEGAADIIKDIERKAQYGEFMK